MDPLEDRRPIDADDRPIIDVEDEPDDEIVDDRRPADFPFEADPADVLDQRASVPLPENDVPEPDPLQAT